MRAAETQIQFRDALVANDIRLFHFRAAKRGNVFVRFSCVGFLAGFVAFRSIHVRNFCAPDRWHEGGKIDDRAAVNSSSAWAAKTLGVIRKSLEMRCGAPILTLNLRKPAAAILTYSINRS